jgi:hypothetical protein
MKRLQSLNMQNGTHIPDDEDIQENKMTAIHPAAKVRTSRRQVMKKRGKVRDCGMVRISRGIGRT